jgi:hypothetical protein
MTMTLNLRFIAIALSLTLLPSLTGCSIFQPFDQAIHIECAQPGVQLTVNGGSYICPAEVQVRRNRTVEVRASLEGYATHLRSVSYHLSTTGVMDLAGGLIIIVPAIGLAFPGAYDIDSPNIYFDMRQSVPVQPEG